MKVYKCALILNPKWRWLGCRPDDTLDGQITVETKYPSKCSGLDRYQWVLLWWNLHDLKIRGTSILVK